MVFSFFASRFRSLALLLPWLVLAVGAGTIPLASQELPPAIQADRLLLEAEQEIQEELYGQAKNTMDQILELQAEHGLEIPEAFWFNHARVSMQARHFEDAIESAMQYLQVTGQGGEHYLAVLELLNEAEPTVARFTAARASGERRAATSRAEAEAGIGGAFRDCSVCPVMTRVPPGSFVMGSSESRDEGPRHEVTIPYPLAVGVFEVTFEEWDACVAGGGCGGHRPRDRGWGRGNRPVIDVSWEDAQGYVAWLSRETAEEYRLLSEAEWEYVARAGTETYWGTSARRQCDYANGEDESVPSQYVSLLAPCVDGFARETAPVGAFRPNAFGLYDVLGNVWEWTEDCWNENYAGAPADGRAWEDGDCTQRVLRGGSWGVEAPGSLRSANRYRYSAGVRNNYFGFRLARTLN